MEDEVETGIVEAYSCIGIAGTCQSHFNKTCRTWELGFWSSVLTDHEI